MISESKAAAKARVRAKVAAIKALPAAERIANTLHATHTTVEAEQLIAEMRAETERQVRAQIAEDFKRLGNRQSSLSWGEAYYIARDGLCRCRGGSKPCDAESIREQVEGGTR
ncbi:hypothetical protein ACFWHL_16490 [Streptomyces massasporeus]